MASVVIQKSCGTAWSDVEVRALIAVWGESDIQEELDGAVRNKVVFTEISQKLKEEGHTRDTEQCRNKIKSLKRIYREIKDNNKETGRGRKSCKFYHQLDAILGHRPATVSPSLLDTGSSQDVESQTNGKQQ